MMTRSSPEMARRWFPIAGLLSGLLCISPASAQQVDGSKMSDKSPGPAGPSREELKDLPGAVQPGEEDEIDVGGGGYPEPDVVKGSMPPPEMPKGPQVLRYRVWRSLSYVVRGVHRSAVRGREELKQVYETSTVVSYRPIEPGEALPSSIWSEPGQQQADAMDLGDDEVRVMMHVDKAYGQFRRPDLLGQTERTHQILRQATMSYRLDGLGHVTDVRVHAPTHPLAKSSISQFARLATMMQPAFPERAVAPGDTWTQQVTYRDSEGLAQFSEDSVNTYTFKKWRPCRDTVCAFITIDQEMKSAGRMSFQERETRGTSLGEGEGWILFDWRRGEVVKSSWSLKGQGFVTALAKGASPKDGGDQTDGDSIEELAKAEVLTEVEVTTERVDDVDNMPPRDPFGTQPEDASKPTE